MMAAMEIVLVRRVEIPPMVDGGKNLLIVTEQ